MCKSWDERKWRWHINQILVFWVEKKLPFLIFVKKINAFISNCVVTWLFTLLGSLLYTMYAINPLRTIWFISSCLLLLPSTFVPYHPNGELHWSPGVFYSTVGGRSFGHQALASWIELREVETMSTFKTELKTFVFDQTYCHVRWERGSLKWPSVWTKTALSASSWGKYFTLHICLLLFLYIKLLL